MHDITLLSKNALPIVNKLAHEIWQQVYPSILSQDQIDYMLQLMYNVPKLESECDKGLLFHLISWNGTPSGFAGHGMSSKSPGVYRLEKIYVLPNLHGSGLGKSLLGFVEGYATNKGAHTLQLNVNRHNKAIGFYNKNGFNTVREEINDIGNGYVMDDYVMQKELTSQSK